MNVLVTGSNGFLGSALTASLKSQGIDVLGTLRKSKHSQKQIAIGEIHRETDWSKALVGIDVVVHCAARVHVMNDTASDPLDDFREVNTRATINLANQASAAGVKRFIFISSIKAGGEISQLGTPLLESRDYVPYDPYGLSKFEAEQQLLGLAENSKIEVVIIRPTLIYGPGVKANFETMMKWASKPIPLPFGAIDNKRSLVYIDNLVSLIEVCLTHLNAKNQIFYVNDDNDLSTSDLLRKLYKSFKNRIPLIPVPTNIIKLFFKLIGKSDYSDRLLGSLQVDISKAKTLLNWEPPYSVDESLDKTVKYFIENRK